MKEPNSELFAFPRKQILFIEPEFQMETNDDDQIQDIRHIQDGVSLLDVEKSFDNITGIMKDLLLDQEFKQEKRAMNLLFFK